MIAYTAVERLLTGERTTMTWCPTCDRVDAGVLYTADQR